MALTYKSDKSEWGLTALYEGYRLVFSANFNASRIRKEKWQHLLPFLKNKPDPKPRSIISNVDVYSLFSQNAKTAWALAFKLSQQRKGKQVGVEDLFLALLQSPTVKNMLQRMKVGTSAAQILLKNYLKLNPPSNSPIMQKVPFEAFVLSVDLKNHKVGSLMLLGALLKTVPQENILQAIFTNIELNLEKLELFSAWILDLDFNFQENSKYDKLLYCCRQATNLEQHFGYYFEFPAIEEAVKLSAGQTLKDLEHKKALQLLVRAAGRTKKLGKKIVSHEMVS
jgi:ATP-dependent Clp protease ATP-binding subunit ClpA